MASQVSASDRALAMVLWCYQHLNQPLPAEADAVIAAGCHDDRVGEHAATLCLRRLAPLLVTSGSFGKITRRVLAESEATRFARIAAGLGVERARIITEPASRNSGENVRFSLSALAASGAIARSVVIVTKCYLERRMFATAVRQAPNVRWTVTSPAGSYESSINDHVSECKLISLLVGDLQRIVVYPRIGYQIAQEVPENVLTAYRALVGRGYTEFLVDASRATRESRFLPVRDSMMAGLDGKVGREVQPGAVGSYA